MTMCNNNDYTKLTIALSSDYLRVYALYCDKLQSIKYSFEKRPLNFSTSFFQNSRWNPLLNIRVFHQLTKVVNTCMQS